jgi:hypothetical protein
MASDDLDAGDTVNVEVGSATWTSPLIITKAISLIGAGAANTVITGQVTSSTRGVVAYEAPAAIANTGSTSFRLTGFTMDNRGYSAAAVTLAGPGGATAEKVYGVRVDNNILYANTTSAKAIDIFNIVFGVIDNNTIYGYCNNESGGQSVTFDALQSSIAFGNVDNLFYEDNTITSNYGLAFGGGHAARYATRYNTITMTNTSGARTVWDMHGNMAGPNMTTMITENYGNLISFGSGGSPRLNVIRGGRHIIFNNYMDRTGISLNHIEEEWNDGLYYYQNITGTGTSFAFSYGLPSDANNTMKIKIVRGTGKGEEHIVTGGQGTTTGTIAEPWVATLDGTSYGFLYYYTGAKSDRLMRPNNTYHWGNRLSDNSLLSLTVYIDSFYYYDNSAANDVFNSTPTLSENVEFWQQRSGAFTGALPDPAACQYNDEDGVLVDTCGTTGGIGCGTLAAIPGTCTTGVAYWATNQSCTDLSGDGVVGASHSANISGTLYKCTATNAWTYYYTPYTYPHPLRGEGTTPSATGCTIQGGSFR